MNAAIILPNQLFEDNPLFKYKIDKYFLVEETLFFNQFKFHKAKILYHRATMKFYEDYLAQKGFKVEYVDSTKKESDIRNLIHVITNQDFKNIYIINPVDDWIERRIQKLVEQNNLNLVIVENPMFLFKDDGLSSFLSQVNSDSRLLQTKFYIYGRKKFEILIENNKPIGNSWTYDKFNREKIPENFPLPEVITYSTPYLNEALNYTKKNFAENYGELPNESYFPLNFNQAKNHLSYFIENKLQYFGPFQDAIEFQNPFLFHSTISAALNVGLITPTYVINEVQLAFKELNLPIQSVEGFIRQILGWREYIRMIYKFYGRKIRTSNYFELRKGKSLKNFYLQKTGLLPVDKALTKLNKIAYNHHIERLMLIGNLMLLLEFHPDVVYEFFMTNYIDAYDWVMVPNVYGMSQFADGGFMATKPYISSSKYILKMSNLKKSDWCEKWDILFWNFMITHYDKLANNPRMIYLLNYVKKMGNKKSQIQKSAEMIKKELLI